MLLNTLASFGSMMAETLFRSNLAKRKMNMQWVLILTIIATLVSILFVYFDYDRKMRLKMTSLATLIDIYSKKPHFSPNRVVGVLETDIGVNDNTIKTILDQSIRLNDIAIQTEKPNLVSDELKTVVSIHKPQTEWLREMDRDTIIIYLQNGQEYPYDWVENEAERKARLLD